jgi:hypothetical protein
MTIAHVLLSGEARVGYIPGNQVSTYRELVRLHTTERRGCPLSEPDPGSGGRVFSRVQPGLCRSLRNRVPWR